MKSGPFLTQPRRFVLATIGTRADVYPLIAIGQNLVRRGHRVVIATPDRHRDVIVAAGIEHRTMRPDVALDDSNPAVRGVPQKKRGGGFAVRCLMYPRAEDTYRDMLELGRDADVLVFPVLILPGPMAAERLNKPWALIHLTPGLLYSDYDPPYLPPAPWLYRPMQSSVWLTRLLNPLARLSIRSWSKPLRDLRKREGFPPLQGDLLLGGMRSPWLTLAMFSECMAERQPDWTESTVVTGFPFLEEKNGASPEVQRFLEAGSPPLMATLGSLVSHKRLWFLENVIAAAQTLGQRLLLIAGPDAETLRARYSSPSLLIVDYVPYAAVFPEASSLIISGSVGPISHGLRAGRPMLVIAPDEGADMPDNALRTVKLGVSRWLRMTRGTPKVLAAHLRALLSNGDYERQARRWSDKVRAEDGIARACEELEALAAKQGETK